MEEKKNPDAIEGLFQRTFEQLGPFPEEKAWNMPSDEVWTDIQSRMAEPKVKRIRPLFWLAAASTIGLILLAGFAQHFYYKDQLHQLSDQLKSNEQKVQQMQQQLATIQQPKSSQMVGQNSNEALVSLRTKPANKALATTLNIQTVSSSNRKSNIVAVQTSPPADVQLAQTPVQFVSGSQFVNDEHHSVFSGTIIDHRVAQLPTDLVTNENKFNTPISSLALASLDLEEISSSSEHLPQSALAPIVRLNQNPKDRLYFGASAGPFWTTKPDHQVNIPGLEAKEVEHSYRAGLHVGIPINSNWSIETGIQYVASSVDVTYPQSVAFSSNDEQFNLSNGMYESNYDLLVSSSSGNVTTDISLSRTPNTSIEDGEQVNVALDLAFKSQQLEIPVVGKYQVNMGPLALSARAGIVSRYLIDEKVAINDVEAQTVGFQSERASISALGNGKNLQPSKLSLHYLAGLGLEYRFHPKWSIALEPTFNRSVKPIIEQGDQKVHQETLGVNFGVRHWL
ncbi:MAG: hypothetical protein AAF985_03205 [Bacteroidota bacterium]